MILLRSIREKKGLTLGDVSKATGLTKSYISQIERGFKQPSIEALRRICAYLEIPISIPLSDAGIDVANKECVVLPKEQRIHSALSNNSSGFDIETLSPEQGPSGLRVFLVKINTGKSASGKQVTHAYPELAYVLKGEVDALIGDNIYHLNEESSIYVASMVPHNYLNSAENMAEILFAFND